MDAVEKFSNIFTYSSQKNVIILVFAFFGFLISVSAFIPYPELIRGEIEIITLDGASPINPPRQGEISKILKETGDSVNITDVLIELYSNSSLDDVKKLEDLLSNDDWLENLNKDYPKYLVLSQRMGDFKDESFQFINKLNDYNTHTDRRLLDIEIGLIKKEINHLKSLSTIKGNVVGLSKKKALYIKNIMEVDSFLFSESTITKVEYLNRKIINTSSLIQLEKELENYLENLEKISVLEKTIIKLNQEYYEKEQKYINELTLSKVQILSQISDWINYNTISARKKGEIFYLENLQLNDLLNREELLGYILNNSDQYIGISKMKESGLGKISIGKQVFISLEEYPFREFGKIKGRIAQIGQISNNGYILIKFDLPTGLLTTYNYNVEFSYKMRGIVEIWNNDQTVFNVIWNNLLSKTSP